MKHEDFQDDQYLLYALGLLDEPERSRLLSHIADRCETCIHSLRNSEEFWYLTATQTEPLQGAPAKLPSSHLRKRILHSVQPPKRVYLFPPIWTWSRAAAGLLVVASVAVSAWYAGSMLRPNNRAKVSAPTSTDPATISRLEQENRDLRTLLERTRQLLARTQAPPQAPPPDNTAPRALEAASKEAAEAKRLAEQLTVSLASEKARAAQLEAELSQQLSQVSALTKDRDALTARNAALEDAQRKSTDLERRLVESQRIIQQYQRTIELQRTRLDTNTQLLAAFSSPSLQVVRLAATEAARGADGHAVIAGGKLLLYTSNLPVLPAGRIYQLWLIRDRNPGIASGGIFTRGAANGLTIQVENPAVVSNIRAIAISEEPAGGSKLPSGHKILIGTVRS